MVKPAEQTNLFPAPDQQSPTIKIMPALEQFRQRVVSHSLFAPCSLKKAMQQLGYVQADPIRSPARAQDLVLRHRVNIYKWPWNPCTSVAR
jgi:hypothetical protein